MAIVTVNTFYQIRMLDTTGTVQYMCTGGPDGGFTVLEFENRVNAVGTCHFRMVQPQLNALDAELLPAIGKGWIIEIYRKLGYWSSDQSLVWTGIVVKMVHSGAFNEILDVYAFHINWLLSTRHVLYRENYANRSKFTTTAAETVMKTIVDYNIGPNATTGNGRLRTGSVTGFVMESDSAGGNSISYKCEYANLLEACQELASIGGGDFEVERYTTGGNMWRFLWHTGQLGTDRSSSIIFSSYWGNMIDASLEVDGSGEKTVAVVLGPGSGWGRTIDIFTGPDYHATTANVEMTVEGSNTDTYYERQAVANAEFPKARTRRKVDFIPCYAEGYPSNAPPFRFYTDFFLGDLITVRYASLYSGTRKVVACTTSYTASEGEIHQLELSDP